jgi:hypothetical protein
MINEEAIDYYLDRINHNKKTKFIFWKIPFPSNSPMLFLFCVILFFALLGIIIGLPLLTIVPAFLICWPYYHVSKLRNHVVNLCIATEMVWQKEFKENGVDPNFPEDPLYVTEDDREDIFDDCLDEAQFDKKSQFEKMKEEWLFILVFIIIYSITAILLYYLLPIRPLKLF